MHSKQASELNLEPAMHNYLANAQIVLSHMLVSLLAIGLQIVNARLLLMSTQNVI